MFLLAVNACDEHRVRDDGTGNADPEVLNVLTRVLHRAEGDASQAGLCKYAWSGVAGGTTAASKGWMLVSAERLRGTRRVEDAQGWASFN